MAQRDIYISYMDAGEWTIFSSLTDRFPLIRYLGSNYIIGTQVKSLGIDLPNVFGIYPTEHPTGSREVTFSFLVRSLENQTEAVQVAEELITFLYVIGEFHLSEQTSPIYRRYKFNNVNQSTVFFGKYGYDIELVFTFTAIDTMNYERELTSINVPLTPIVETTDEGTRYLFIGEMSDTVLRARPLITITANQNFVTEESYFAFTNVREQQSIGFAFTMLDGPIVTPNTYIIDCENRTAVFNYRKSAGGGAAGQYRDYNLVQTMYAITNDIKAVDDPYTLINDKYLFDFPNINYGTTQVAICLYNRSGAGSASCTMNIIYRRRWL